MNFKAVGIGEVLWDVLPEGKHLGGAPANFAYHIQALGGTGAIISRVGRDDPGREILARIGALGLTCDTIEVDPSAPTSTVNVTVDRAGHPQYVIHENVAWDNLAGEPAGRAAVAEAAAVCFGTLAQRAERSRETIRSLVAETRAHALRIFDVNLRQNYYSQNIIEASLRLANVLKMNDNELPQIAEIFQLRGDVRTQIQRLVEFYELRAVALTRGNRGSLLYENGRWSDHPGAPARVVDTVGAGDSFTAALTLGLLAGWELEQINERANDVAAFVASSAGATPALTAKVRSPFLSVSTSASGVREPDES